ncbi:hypothetical protein JCGZ_19075 [Jatropha curcas]|uniref:MATH domain-containing protein n=1 Tax=Jatropha curcas TaxID=180498 RepID=A0A067K6U5_JATCU|nr:uncharacterized protein LOC105643616 [Jatropha curcas]KDP27995.1 hypothetical protein JCGZ_19075 [Jatropha curcas]
MGDDKLLSFRYQMRIDTFSDVKVSMEKYKSAVFKFGGYEWTLVIHPNGNKSKNVTDHISFYLALEKTVPLGSEVHANFRLLLLDQYLPRNHCFEIEGCFHPSKHECGVDKFILFKALDDYLAEGSCTFGVEVISVREQKTGKGECLSIIEGSPTVTHKWKIDQLSSKLKQERIDSDIFTAGTRRWKIELHPKGTDVGKETHLSVYLALADPVTTCAPNSRVYADITVRIMDDKAKHELFTGKDSLWFSASSPKRRWSTFISLDDLDKLKKRLHDKDICFVKVDINVVEAEVQVLP